MQLHHRFLCHAYRNTNANNIPSCSRIVSPTLVRTSQLEEVLTMHLACPIPTIIAAAGNTATGSINDLPKF